MKKERLFVVFIFISQILFSQGNKGVITYEIKYNENYINNYWEKERSTIKDKMVLHTRDQMHKKGLTATGILKFSGAESLYKVKDKLNVEMDLSENIIKSYAGGDNKYYYNNITNTSLEEDCYLLGECFIIKNDIYDWKITNNTKLIGNNICKSAELVDVVIGKKRKIVAWYAPSIKYPFGPIGYNGLKGLILELSIDNKIFFRAKKIELNKKNTRIRKIKNTAILSEAEFEKLCRKNFPKELFDN